MTVAAIAVWHASLIEIIWTLIGLAGIWFNQKQMKRTREYIEAVRKLNGHNLRRHRELRILAYGHFRNALFRMAMTGTILMVGVLAMLVPATPGMSKITPVGAIITFGLFMLELLIILPGVLDEKQAEALEDDPLTSI